MLVLGLILAILATAAIYPGWRFARRGGATGVEVLFLPFGAIICWVALAAVNVGAQSMSNAIELVPVALVAVVVAYIGFAVLRRKPHLGQVWPLAAYAGVLLFVVSLRLLMPLLPE